MMMDRLKREEPTAQNVTKVRITAYSRDDVDRAAAALAAGWKHHQIRKIIQAAELGKKRSETMSYCIMLWN